MNRLFTGSNDQTVKSYNIKVIEVEKVFAQENLTAAWLAQLVERRTAMPQTGPTLRALK